MKKTFLSILFVFTFVLCFASSDGRQFLGINIFQLPSTTFNLNYSKEIRPFLTGHVDVGYTFDYGFHKNDLLEKYMSDYWMSGYNYHDVQSGGYLKLGTFFNLRTSYTKVNYFRLGLFFANSIVYEDYMIEDAIGLHQLFIPGISGSCGYELELSSRFRASLDFQLSSSIIKNDLSTSNCFVPGMGLSENGRNLYPMVILNIKFDLNKKTDR